MPDSLTNASLSIKDWANSSLPTPTDLAIASCWITFILPNSADEPTCFATSAAAPAISLFNANLLASSRFNSLPVSNSASISLEIESSKFNNPLDILEACSKFNPNCFDLTTDSANAEALPPNDNFKDADALPTSFKISFSLTINLF